MSEDEVIVLVLGASAAGAGALHWYLRIFASPALDHLRRLHLWLGAAPPIALVSIFAVIATAGSYDVRGAPQYLLLYMALGGFWIFGAAFLMDWFGVSFRDDAVERRNVAAAIVVTCAMTAHAIIYAGANVGDGPGWWCVLWAALIGSGAWFLLWAIVEICCAASEEITVERDIPAAIRFGGYMLAAALICARGSAGDWTSFPQTVIEFQAAWPVLPLTAGAIALELLLRRRPRQARPQINGSVYVAAAYVAVAVIAVQLSDPLPHNPQYDLLAR